MPVLTPAQAKKILKKRGITDPAVIKTAIKAVERKGPRAIDQLPRTTGPSSIQRQAATADIATVQQLQTELIATGKKLPVKVAVASGLKGVIAMAGVKLTQAILRAPGTRQAAEKIAGRATTLKPLFGRGPTLGQAAAFGGGVIAGETILQGAQGLVGQAERLLQQKSAINVPRQPQLALPPGGAPVQHGTGRALATLPGVGGMLPPGSTVVKTWNTGTAQFARLADGRIAVQRKDGTIKTYRPQKHIVIPRNPRIGTLIRADKRLDRLVKGLRKVVKSGKR